MVPKICSFLALTYDYSLDLLRGPDGELPQKLRNLEPCFIEKNSNEI